MQTNGKAKEDKENFIPIEDFFHSYEVCRRRKRNTVNALKFEINYERNLVKLWQDVNNFKYKIGKSITFVITRPKLREIFAADFRDRVIHHVIMQRLEPIFENIFIEDSYSCRKDKGVLYGVNRLLDQVKLCSNEYTEDCWIGKFDIQGFFMSINKNILWNKLENLIENEYDKKDKLILLDLVKKVTLHCPQNNCVRKSDIRMWDALPKNKSLFTCNQDCGLPIGNHTSQCFANFYLNDFDHYMKNKFKYYGRYVDDFFIITKTKGEIVDSIEEIRNFLSENLHLTLHPNKIYTQRYEKGTKFIGFRVKKNLGNAGKELVSNLYRRIHRFNILPTTAENAREFFCTLNSFYGFLGHYDSIEKRKKIWDKIDRKWKGIFWIDKDFKKISLHPHYSIYKQTKNEFKKGTGDEKYF